MQRLLVLRPYPVLHLFSIASRANTATHELGFWSSAKKRERDPEVKRGVGREDQAGTGKHGLGPARDRPNLPRRQTSLLLSRRRVSLDTTMLHQQRLNYQGKLIRLVVLVWLPPPSKSERCVGLRRLIRPSFVEP